VPTPSPSAGLLAAATKAPVLVPHGLTAWNWIHAGIILAASVALCIALRRSVGRFGPWSTERTIVKLLERVLTYLVVISGALYALGALHIQVGPLLGALGIGGIALAFALQDTLQNLVAGIILQARRPFRRGDQVRLDNYEGVVEDVDLRNVALLTYDGLNVFLPNKTVLEKPIVNYTRTPTRRTQLTVGVAVGTDLGKAQQLLVEAVAATEVVLSSPAPDAWVKEFGESSIDFEVLFWHAVDRASVWRARSDVAMNVKSAMEAAGVAFSTPQRELHISEG
jgi:small conductance mechanosensitive channel